MSGANVQYEDSVWSVKLALVVLFGGVGAMFGAAAFEKSWRFAPSNLVVGACLIMVAVGLWRHWRWARLAALGGCFVALLIAIFYPAWVFTRRPFVHLDRDGAMTLAICALAAVVAFIAYQGISYLRSPLAQLRFSRTQDGVAALAAEAPAVMVVAALLWIGLLRVATIYGLQYPQWLTPAPLAP